MDRRQIKTQAQIKQVFIHLLAQQPLILTAGLFITITATFMIYMTRLWPV